MHSERSDARFVLAAEHPPTPTPTSPTSPHPSQIRFRVGKQSDMKDRSVHDGEPGPDAINLTPLPPVSPVFIACA